MVFNYVAFSSVYVIEFAIVDTLNNVLVALFLTRGDGFIMIKQANSAFDSYIYNKFTLKTGSVVVYPTIVYYYSDIKVLFVGSSRD